MPGVGQYFSKIVGAVKHVIATQFSLWKERPCFASPLRLFLFSAPSLLLTHTPSHSHLEYPRYAPSLHLIAYILPLFVITSYFARYFLPSFLFTRFIKWCLTTRTAILHTCAIDYDLLNRKRKKEREKRGSPQKRASTSGELIREILWNYREQLSHQKETVVKEQLSCTIIRLSN